MGCQQRRPSVCGFGRERFSLSRVRTRAKMDADKLGGTFMPNPKDLRIAELEGEIGALKSKLEECLKQ